MFKNFHPIDYFGCDGSDPGVGTIWARWVGGREPSIPSEFALSLWWHLCEALEIVVSAGVKGPWPAEYRKPSAKKRFSRVVEDLILQILVMQVQERQELILPYRFERLFRWESHDDAENNIKTHALYTAWCFDRCLGGLLCGDAVSSSVACAYGFQSLSLAHQYRRSIDIGSTGTLEARLKSEMGRNGALARHAENNAMKADVFRWLDSNMTKFKSMDAAAGAIAGKIAPVVFRTARTWITEWKTIRSAGTP